MVQIFKLDQIKAVLPHLKVGELMEEAFIAYSAGKVVVPPVGELLFEDPPGEAHIKYGYIKSDDYFIVKIASGFYNNHLRGLPSSQGVVLLFSQKTGQIKVVFLDGGYLTDIRTAAAAAVAVRCLKPSVIERIGIAGTGIQGRSLLKYLGFVTDCRKVLVWARSEASAEDYLKKVKAQDFEIEICYDAKELAKNCNLIVTATASREPLLFAEDLRPGTHIVALGSDTAEKIELDPKILAIADIVVSDSLSQSKSRGEVFRAVQAGAIEMSKVQELGMLLQAKSPPRTNDEQITVIDLTGVAAQDITLAKAVWERMLHG